MNFRKRYHQHEYSLKAQGREDELLLSGDEIDDDDDEIDSNSDDDDDDDNNIKDDSDSDDEIHIQGALDPDVLRSTLHRKKANKAERLAKIISGREKFSANARSGGSTNLEKTRKKLFTMTKHSDASNRKRYTKYTAGLCKKRRDAGKVSDPRKRRRK